MKKRFLKKLILGTGAVLCALSLGACESVQQKQQEESKKFHNQGNTELPTDNYFEEDQKQGIMRNQQHRALNQVAKEMSSNYKKIGNVKYDQKHDAINTALQGTQMSEITQYYSAGNPSAKKFLKELTSGLQKTSVNISKQIKDNNVKFNLYDTNHKLIYSVQNGNVTKNI